MILLEVPFSQKDQAKSLGARWNPAEKKWYIPDDLADQVKAFEQWMPGANQLKPTNDGISEIIDFEKPNDVEADAIHLAEAESEKGIPLSSLMGRVQNSLRQAFAGALWVQAEIANLNERRGHIYLELSEMNAQGQPIATCRAMIWQRQAQRLLQQFEQATGSALQTGQSILFLAEVSFHEKFGFSLVLQDIDPSFTLGALEANLNQIRQQLINEKLYTQNKQFSLPKDFFRVAVIAPPAAAGLGDFRADADLLHAQNLCEFHYFYSSFQGEKVESEMLAAFDAFKSMHEAKAFDALVIIRGGGAKLDLNPLNLYSLAKWITQINLPVITGIGHERDSTILDEVASVRFDTPSKVVAGIRQVIFSAAQQASQHWGMIERASLLFVQQQKQSLVAFEASVQQASTAIVHQQKQILLQYERHIEQASRAIVHQQKQILNPLIYQVEQQGTGLLKQHKQQVRQWQQAIQIQTQTQLSLQKQLLERHLDVVKQRPLFIVQQARNVTQQRIAFVLSSGPKTQLSRGFALIKDQNNKPLTQAKQALEEVKIQVEFSDGTLEATPVKLMNKELN